MAECARGFSSNQYTYPPPERCASCMVSVPRWPCSKATRANNAALVAAGASAIWMLMPLLASSSLLIVQRMTTLSALLMLLGMVGYMCARRAIGRRPLLALAGMTLALGAGASLGALAKENGILIFAFILATELVLLDRPLNVSRSAWRAWFGLVLVGPLVLLSLYLMSCCPIPRKSSCGAASVDSNASLRKLRSCGNTFISHFFRTSQAWAHFMMTIRSSEVSSCYDPYSL
jgi:4-amino-4-deoxy-L-arabinose transferase-like glycosyltransferase